jgi:hypothetical protein
METPRRSRRGRIGLDWPNFFEIDVETAPEPFKSIYPFMWG